MDYSTDHLTALHTRLSNETARHGDNPKMAHYLDSIRREIKNEEKFLSKHGVETYSYDGEYISTNDILKELGI